MNYFRLFLLQTHYKLAVLKTFLEINQKNLPTFFAFHNTHQRAQHSEGTKRHDARHVAKLLLPNYQNVKSYTALLACKTLLAWSYWRLGVIYHGDNWRWWKMIIRIMIYFYLHKLTLGITLSNCYGRRQTPYGDILSTLPFCFAF